MSINLTEEKIQELINEQSNGKLRYIRGLKNIRTDCHWGMYVRTISDAFSRQHKCFYEKDVLVSNLKDNLKRYKECVKKITKNLKELER